jgi:hypothetical protein
VGDQDVPEPGQVEAGALGGRRSLGAAVEQQHVVEQRCGLAAE